MMRTLRMALVLLLASSTLVVVPSEVGATVPGAIGRIVFVSDADSGSEIYVRDFADSSPVRLTNNTDSDSNPIWSPDGTRIAFDRSPSKGVNDLWVMDPDGSNEKNLTNGTGSTTVALDWSPDGSRILFASDRGGNLDLWIIRPDGSDPMQLTDTTESEWSASWAADGRTIIYERSNDIWMMDADGSNQRALLARPELDGMPALSPNGRQIAFTSGQSGVDNVWIMNADGSQPYSLTNSVGWESYGPAWSPDGAKIAYTSGRDGDYDIWMMDADGTNQVHLTDNPANESSADWESVNRDPNAVDDRVDGKRGRSVVVDVLGNDSEPDGEGFALNDITRMPEEGSVTINDDGTLTYAHSGVGLSPGIGYPYPDVFEYEIQDERLGTARAEVSVWLFPSFDDVPDSNVFIANIEWLAMSGITMGCNPPDNTMFCPGDPVTRGQMAAFLVRARGYSDGVGADLFNDDDGSVFETDIDKLGTEGVTKGCNPPVNDRYCPGQLVTRGQMAAFLVRAYSLSDIGLSNLFVDDNDSVFEADIDKLGANGVSLGCNPPENDRFCPDEPVTREQMAAFLYRVDAGAPG